jgi:hypothetical protein
MDLLDQKNIVSALSKVLKGGIPFDLEYYDRTFITKKCAERINRELIPQGYSVVISDFVNLDVYYIKINQKLVTINITEKGISFPRGTKRELLAGISPVITTLIEELTILSEN